MESIRERIRAGVYGPGQALPAERTLAREFGTNHETANKAVAHLVAEGVLQRRRGIGTFVASAATAAGQPNRIVDILIHKQAAELFGASSFHEEIVFLLQSRLAARGLGCNIVPVPDLSDFDSYAARAGGFVISKFLPYRYLDRIEKTGKPVVAVNFDPGLARCTPVIVEHRAVEQLCRHLLGLGHRRIAFARAPGFDFAAETRQLRFRAFMEMAELPANLERIVVVETGADAGQTSLPPQLLECTAVMAADDFAAIKLRQQLARAGLAVPEDLSLTGYGNLSITRSLYPTLTTADVDREALCAGVAEAIEEALDGGERWETRFFASRAVMRSSTAPPRSRQP